MANQQTKTGVAVSSPSTTITFDVAMDTATYHVMFQCYNLGPPYESIACDVSPTNFTTTTFKAEPAEAALLDYTASEQGITPAVLVPATRLSRDYTALDLWTEAVRDVLTSPPVELERFRLINRAVMNVGGVIYPLVSSSYMSELSVANTGDTLPLGGIKLMMVGAEQRLIVEAAGGRIVRPVDVEERQIFGTGAVQNKNTIVWAYSGSTLYLKKSDDITTYPTLTIKYPRVPIEVVLDTNLIDLPDGATMSLALLKLKSIVAERMKMPAVDRSQEVRELVTGLFTNLGVQAELEEIEAKVKAIL